jgi:hypothetical protein
MCNVEKVVIARNLEVNAKIQMLATCEITNA